jgi:hypothetical protein
VLDRQHDDGVKSILGESGRFRGDDIPPILLKQPSCAMFLCRKLFRALVSETQTPSDELIAPLAQAFRKSAYQIRVPLEMILRSSLFFDPAVRRQRVKSPVEFAVGTIRSLEVMQPTVKAESLAEACNQMGQSLFAPPSVAGWEGGPAWINSTSMIGRTNLVLALLSDDGGTLGQPIDPEALPARYGFHQFKTAAAFYLDLLAQDTVEPALRREILESENATKNSLATGLREVARILLTRPQYQLS